MVNLEAFQREPVDCFDDEVDEIVFRHPVTEIWGQELRCFTVDTYEAGAHGPIPSLIRSLVKSDRLLACHLISHSFVRHHEPLLICERINTIPQK